MQLVAAWITDSSAISWSLFQTNATTGVSPITGQATVLRSLKKPHAVAVNLGNYDGSGAYELALGVIDEAGVRTYLYTIDQFDDTFPMTQTKVITVHSQAQDSAPLWGSDPLFPQRVKYRPLPHLLNLKYYHRRSARESCGHARLIWPQPADGHR